MPSGPIQEVTGSYNSAATNNINITITAPSNGDTLILLINMQHGSSTVSRVSSISGTGTSGWIRLATSTVDIVTTTRKVLEIWAGDVGSGAGTTVNVVFTSTQTSGVYDITEWSGLNSVATIVDVADAGNGANSGNTPSIAGFTSTQTDMIILGLMVVGESITAHPSGYTALTFANSLQGEYQFNVAAGAQTASWTKSSTGHWWCTGVSLKFPAVVAPSTDSWHPQIEQPIFDRKGVANY